jgi:recombination protein RecA
LAVQKGLIQKGGAWFTVGDERFQGRDNARQYLQDNPEIASGFETQIRDAFGLNVNGKPAAAAKAEAKTEEE